MALASLLRELRTQAMLTQDELAARAGLSEGTSGLDEDEFLEVGRVSRSDQLDEHQVLDIIMRGDAA